MLEIIKINSKDYPQGKSVEFTYQSDKYYDVLLSDNDNWG